MVLVIMLCTTPPISLKLMWCDFQIKKINLRTLNIMHGKHAT
jgi:hypothetical protein